MMKNLTTSSVCWLLITVLVFVLGGTIGYRLGKQGTPLVGASNKPLVSFNLTNTDQPSEFRTVDFGQFWEVWEILKNNYVDPTKVDQQKMVYGAIQGMTGALGDPYTVFLPPELDKRAAEDLAGSFYGVGIELGYIDETLAVVAPLKGMPAEQAGVQAGDLILHVKDTAKGLDEDTNGWALDEAVNKIRGPKDSSVFLTLFRKNNGAEPFVVELKRTEIVIPSVESTVVDHNGKRVAHIQLSRFGERTDAEWDGIVRDILQQNPKLDGIVLDMRNNPGGFFDGAIAIASEFIEQGNVVSQQGKFETKEFKVNGKARLASYPLVVLVNKGSASASEIVAGALRDVKKSKLVGEKTFGKGTVQDRLQLEGDAGLHVTVAKWLLPAGGSIDHEGLPVDVEIKNDPATEGDEALLKAIEQL